MHIDSRGYGYRTYRDGGRVRREYVGRGEWIHSLAYFDQMEAQEREEARQQRRADRERLEAQDAEFAAYFDGVTAIMREVLTANGYHLHARSVWRKKREAMPKTATKTNKSADSAAGEHAVEKRLHLPPPENEIFTLLSRTQDGDKSAAGELMEALRKPEHAESRRRLAEIGDMEWTARQAVAHRCAGNNLLVEKSFELHMEELSRQVAGPNPSALETLLAERVAVCQVRLNYYETILAQNQAKGGFSCDDADNLEQRIDKLHKRYLSAIKALAQVRKLQLPAVQINVAEKQVYIAQANGAV